MTTKKQNFSRVQKNSKVNIYMYILVQQPHVTYILNKYSSGMLFLVMTE